jgi:SpoVK/Ycf46/Vps4 family AAA+-type ATPase
MAILEELVQGMDLSVDVDLKRIARETAALTAIDLSNLIDRAHMAAMKRLNCLGFVFERNDPELNPFANPRHTP